MSSTEIIILTALAVFIIMMRLDRLGRQVEAVYHLLRAEIVEGDEEREEELRLERESDKKEKAKERRQFWIFWAIIGALVLGYALLSGG